MKPDSPAMDERAVIVVEQPYHGGRWIIAYKGGTLNGWSYPSAEAAQADLDEIRTALAYEAAKPVAAGDLVSRAEVLRVLKRLGDQDADLALYGAEDNARAREYGEAAMTRACCAVAIMPASRLASLEAARSAEASCDEQLETAIRLAENVGYMVVPDPVHADGEVHAPEFVLAMQPSLRALGFHAVPLEAAAIRKP